QNMTESATEADRGQPARTSPVQANDRTGPDREADGIAARVPGKESPAAQANRTGLPHQLKTGVESLSGISLHNVNVHYNSAQPAQLNALAYAQGSDIYVAPGQETHLPHEAWHIVQQKQGRVRPTMQMRAGVQVNNDPHLESEATAKGQEAL